MKRTACSATLFKISCSAFSFSIPWLKLPEIPCMFAHIISQYRAPAAKQEEAAPNWIFACYDACSKLLLAIATTVEEKTCNSKRRLYSAAPKERACFGSIAPALLLEKVAVECTATTAFLAIRHQCWFLGITLFSILFQLGFDHSSAQ